MSAAIYLVSEKEVLGLPVIDGKQLSNALDDLDALAQTLNLELLSDFIHITNNELEDALDSAGVDLMDFMIPETQWFEAENLLETVFALRVHLEKYPASLQNSRLVLPDLRALELALELCEAKEVPVRLTIDI
jgi:hypothetical protein